MSNQLDNFSPSQPKIAAAIQHYTKVVETHPDSAEAHLKLANVYGRQANWQGAIACYRQAIKLNPQQAEAYYGLGTTLKKIGKLEQAAQSRYRALKLQPGLAQAKEHYELGKILWQQGKQSQAVVCYRQAIELNPNFGQAYLHLGQALTEQKKWDEAIACYQKLTELEPNSAQAYANLGSCYAQQQKWPQALASYRKAIKLNPQLAGVHRNLAKVLQLTGKPDQATQHWYGALSLEPNSATPEEHYHLGQTLFEQGKLAQAAACYRRAIQLKPDLAEAYEHLASILARQGKPEKALATYQMAVKKNPQNGKLHLLLGQALAAQQKWQKASAAYERVIELVPDSPLAYFNLGAILVHQEKWPAAIECYQKVLELQPQSWEAYHYLGQAWMKQKKSPEAVSSLSQAIALNPNSVWSYYYLGVALTKQEKWDEAIAAFLAAIQLQSELPEIVYQKLGAALRQRWPSDLEATIEYYQQSIPLKPENQTPEFYLQLGNHHLQQQQYEAAIIFYRLALNLKPDDSVTRLKLEEAVVAKRQIEEKIADYRQKIGQQPNLPSLYRQLGNLLTKRGDIGEAIGLHQQAMALEGWNLTGKNYQFKYDYFTHNIPIWKQHLQPWAGLPQLQILEIGSFEGMASCWLLDHILTHPSARLTCVDIYFQDNFEQNLAQTGAAKKVTKLRGNSHKLLPTLQSNFYDLIYIDGCHLATHVQQDAILSWNLLKEGRLMIFDDYELQDPQHPGEDPQIGIDAFLESVAGKFEILHKQYQVIIKKRRH